MHDNFDYFFAEVLKSEGVVYEDVAGDNGGPTKCGITIADVARWNNVPLPGRDAPGWDALVTKVRALTPETAGLIYKKFYWDTVRADELPAGIDFCVVDYAVNSGPGRAIPALGQAVGFPTIKMTDNLIAATVRFTHAAEGVINSIQDERREFLKRVAEQPKNRKFRDGWLNREARVRQQSIALANKTPVIAMPRTIEAPAPAPASAPLAAVSTAYNSKTVWATLMGAGAWVAQQFKDAVDTAWDWIGWAMGVLPSTVTEVKTTLTNGEMVFSWLKLSWVKVSIYVAVACLVIVIIRHVNDKLKLAAATKPQ